MVEIEDRAPEIIKDVAAGILHIVQKNLMIFLQARAKGAPEEFAKHVQQQNLTDGWCDSFSDNLRPYVRDLINGTLPGVLGNLTEHISARQAAIEVVAGLTNATAVNAAYEAQLKVLTDQHRDELAAAQATSAMATQEALREQHVQMREAHLSEMDSARVEHAKAISEAASQATANAYTEATIRQQAAVEATRDQVTQYMEGRLDARAEQLLQTATYQEHLVNRRIAEERANIRAEARLMCDDNRNILVDVFKGFEVLQNTIKTKLKQPQPLALSDPSSTVVASVTALSQTSSPPLQPAASSSQSTASFQIVPEPATTQSSTQPGGSLSLLTPQVSQTIYNWQQQAQKASEQPAHDAETVGAMMSTSLPPAAPSIPLLDNSTTNIISAVEDGTNSVATTQSGVVRSAGPGNWLDLGLPNLRVSPVSVLGTTAAQAAMTALADAHASMTAMERTLTVPAPTPAPSATHATSTPLRAPDLVDHPELAGHESVRPGESELAHIATIAPANLPQEDHANDGAESVAPDTDDTATVSGYNERVELEHGNDP